MNQKIDFSLKKNVVENLFKLYHDENIEFIKNNQKIVINFLSSKNSPSFQFNHIKLEVISEGKCFLNCSSNNCINDKTNHKFYITYINKKSLEEINKKIKNIIFDTYVEGEAQDIDCTEIQNQFAPDVYATKRSGFENDILYDYNVLEDNGLINFYKEILIKELQEVYITFECRNCGKRKYGVLCYDYKGEFDRNNPYKNIEYKILNLNSEFKYKDVAEIPEELRLLMSEAIKTKNEKCLLSSLVMFRVVLEKVLILMGFNGGNLQNKIDALRKDINKYPWLKASNIDIFHKIRILGNFVAHPGEKVTEDYNEITEGLLELVNFIFDDLFYNLYIAEKEKLEREKELNALYSKINIKK